MSAHCGGFLVLADTEFVHVVCTYLSANLVRKRAFLSSAHCIISPYNFFFLCTSLLGHKSALYLSSLLPLLTFCHVPLSPTHTPFPSLITAHFSLTPISLPLSLNLLIFTTSCNIHVSGLSETSASGPIPLVLSIFLYWFIHRTARTLLVHLLPSQRGPAAADNS